MEYNFDRPHDRRHSNSYKWDIPENEIPMWVADMDFQTAPAVIEALRKRVEVGSFGYNIVPEEWYEAIENWWKNRHHYEIRTEWLTFCTGVVPALTCAVKRMTNHGDHVAVMTPVYDIFFHSIENTGRHVLESPLVYQNGSYTVDFSDLEEKLSHPLTTMLILCNPHNPVGKIWTKEELAQIGELCKKHHVMVFSDEIHCDLCDPGKEYIPFASASGICESISITAVSASKAFNIAGLQTAAVFTPDEGLRNKIVRGLNTDEIAEPNSFAIQAVIAAFTEGGEWLDALNAYIYENKQTARAFIKERLPMLHVVDSDATYLLWVDCSSIAQQTDELCTFLRKEAGLYLSQGSHYRGDGAQFVRMNLACPRSQVEEGLRRLEKGITQFLKRDTVL